MSLAATQIPKPSDEQAFERACVPLWCGLLGDPNVQRNGRRGQRQNGVDLFGMRGRDPSNLVGIQCKLKGDGQSLAEPEVREEVRKALTFKPTLREYFVVTTAPDDVAMQELAREITAELYAAGTPMHVYVWGWGTLEEKIARDAEARKAFDPTFDPYSERLLKTAESSLTLQAGTRTDMLAGFQELTAHMIEVKARLGSAPGDVTVEVNLLEAHLDAEIDAYREMSRAGKPRAALPLLERLLARMHGSASGRILFRVKANIGHCLLALGDDDRAVAMLEEAYSDAPKEPKAIANRAFALLFQGRWEEALRFGAPQAHADPTNADLAGYVVQAARFDPSIEDPLTVLPEAARHSAPVEVGRVDFLRRRGRPEWRQAARDAAAAYPDESHLSQFAAEADLDEILSSESFQLRRILEGNERARVEAAATLLASSWSEAAGIDGMVRPEDAALCGNAIVGFFALNDLPRAKALAEQGLDLVPGDEELPRRAAAVAAESGDEALTRRVLSILPAGPDATVLAFRFHSSRGDWAEVVRIYREHADLVPENDRILVTTAGKLAEIKLSTDGKAAERIEQVAVDVGDDPRGCIAVADFALQEGLDAVAEAAFNRALAAIGDTSHVAERLTVAFHAARRGDWRAASDLLDGHVASDQDSPELRSLARAHVNNSPIRQRAIRFFEALPPLLRSKPFYLQAEGLLHLNRGDLPTAEKSLRAAIQEEPGLDSYLALFSVLRRSGRDEEIKPILDSIDLDDVKGTPGQKMHLAQVLRAAGEGTRAIAFAYGVLRSARHDPDAAMRYLGLVFMQPSDTLFPTPDVVDIDTWVRLEGSDGEAHSFTVEEGPDLPADDVVSPSHLMAASAMGLAVGGRFTVPAAFGDDREWTVAEIKHKYLHVLHDVIANFERRFPGAKGFRTIRMREGDIEPALEQVRKTSESHRGIADLYLRDGFPLEMAAARHSGGPVQFAEYVRFLGSDITTCVGLEAERLLARDAIAARRAGGAVLDAYTAWTAATMDSFDVLAAVFGSITVPRSVIDTLRSMKEDVPGERKSLTLGWHDGQFYKQEHTREEIARRNSFIAEQVAKIEKACLVQPVTAPDKLSDAALAVTEVFGAHVLDAAYLALDGGLLVSEDMHFREWARAAVGADGVWLQPVFAFAQDRELIDATRCARAATGLAWRRHDYVAIDPLTLLEAFRADDNGRLDDFTALAAFIGTPGAHMRSHLDVTAGFLTSAWEQAAVTDLKVMKATAILLERLTQGRKNGWAVVLAYLLRTCPAAVREYIHRWAKGHFLPTAAIERASEDLVSRTGPGHRQAADQIRAMRGKRKIVRRR